MTRLRIETEIGEEVQCSKCGDFWPADGEFFYMNGGRCHSWCKDCYNSDPKTIAKKLRHSAKYQPKKTPGVNQIANQHGGHP